MFEAISEAPLEATELSRGEDPLVFRLRMRTPSEPGLNGNRELEVFELAPPPLFAWCQRNCPEAWGTRGTSFSQRTAAAPE